MGVSLYTSRVILSALGVEDYGIYNVVGGVVAMFGTITGSLASAISRFFTFELGKGDKTKLKEIFTACIVITLLIAIILIFIGETFGLWFINNKLNIDIRRIYAVNWIFQFSLVTLCIGIVSIPYNSAIVAHERMSVFAYISIAEALLKLIICFLVTISDNDRLILYGFLIMMVSVVVRVFYQLYCRREFEECICELGLSNKKKIVEIFSFAGWSCVTHSIYIFNTHGVNILMNQFFHVTLNAARGIAVQVEGAVVSFVKSFMTAMYPQITKLYAAGKIREMEKLVCGGAKFSFILFWLIGLPLLMETEFVLRLWLIHVPDHTINFLRLTIIASMIDRFGDTISIACRATGNIKRYVLTLSSVTILIFPLSYISFASGLSPEFTYVWFITIYLVVNILQLFLMRKLLGLSIKNFVIKSVIPVLLIATFSCPIPYYLMQYSQPSFYRLVSTICCCSISTIVITWLLGLSKYEKENIVSFVHKKIKSIKK